VASDRPISHLDFTTGARHHYMVRRRMLQFPLGLPTIAAFRAKCHPARNGNERTDRNPKKTKKPRPFDPAVFLETTAKGRTISTHRKKDIIFSQGDTSLRGAQSKGPREYQLMILSPGSSRPLSPNRNVAHVLRVDIHDLNSEASRQNSSADVTFICLSLNNFGNWDPGARLSCPFE